MNLHNNEAGRRVRITPFRNIKKNNYQFYIINSWEYIYPEIWIKLKVWECFKNISFRFQKLPKRGHNVTSTTALLGSGSYKDIFNKENMIFF